jgi:hypothetical protein
MQAEKETHKEANFTPKTHVLRKLALSAPTTHFRVSFGEAAP